MGRLGLGFTIFCKQKERAYIMTNSECQAAYDRGDFDAILADEIRGYLQLDDNTLEGLGLRRDSLEAQLADIERA